MRLLRPAALAAALAAPALAAAQSATNQATATVVTPLVVSAGQNLAFGNVFQGVARTLPRTDANSGRFQVTGFGTSQVALTFTLPATLASGSNTMPIDSWDVGTNGTNAAAGSTAISVTTGTPVNANLVANNLWIFIGARVQPGASQAAGAYAGTIALAAAYTGN